ncbi:MAG TPA: ATP-binding protein [Polyangia bacterium]
MSKAKECVDDPTTFDPHILLYARNLAASGLIARARPSAIRDLPLVSSLLHACAGPDPERSKLRDGELIATLIAASRAAGPPTAAVADTLTEHNLFVLGQVLELDQHARDVLRLLLSVQHVWELRSLLHAIPCRSYTGGLHVVAAALGTTAAALDATLGMAGRLNTMGFVQVNRTCDDFDEFLTLDGRIADLLSELSLAPEAILRRFLPAAPAPTVTTNDFPMLEKELALATQLLRAATARGVRGVNLLIHGATGAGKTQLARLLAHSIGATLFVAGRDDGQGDSPSALERLTSLRLGQRALAGSGAVLLFDELEDLFTRDTLSRVSGRERRDVARMSKVWFNQVLEETPVPTIWISNDVSAVDPAYLRRFAFALELRTPSRSQRRRLWDRHLGEASGLPAPDRDALATGFAMSPAQIEMAARMAGLLEGEVARATIESLIAPIAALVTPSAGKTRALPVPGYDAAAICCATDLRELAEQLSQLPTDRGVSLCLSGPPGTGKSEYVRHLAQRMGREVVIRRCSDILSMWVGGTERALADAFREAREEGAVLLFDEADSFLRDRRFARQSWEITHTNEFLQQLEEFPGVVVCTTNLVDDLDPACLRRFVFKLRFDFLRPAQIQRLFHGTLGELASTSVRSVASGDDLTSALDRVSRLDRLTPGDFAAVKRRLTALGQPTPPERLVAELEAEVRLKQGRASGRVGFSPGAFALRATDGLGADAATTEKRPGLLTIGPSREY